MKKNFFFYIHSIAGIISAIFILALSLSGAVLVFHDEVDSLQQPTAVNSRNKPLLSVDSTYRIIQQQYPHAQISNVTLADNNDRCFIFSIYDSAYKNGTDAMQVFLHPQTGQVLKTRGSSSDIKNNFTGWLSVFHNSFRLHKKGEWLLGLFAVLFLVSCITGIILYRKNMAAVLLFRKAIYKKQNLHQLIGTWALLFNLMIGVSGYWMQRYVFKKEFYQANNYTPVLKKSPSLFFNYDSAYAVLKNKYKNFTGHVIYFAQSKKGSTAIYGSNSYNSFIHSKKFADAIMLDSTGAVKSTRFINTISADDRYDIINSQIHFGKYGGLPVKIIYAALGILTALLSITGVLLWLRRYRSK